MNTKNKGTILKRVNVFLMIILSIFSLGVYIGIWFINRARELKLLDQKRRIPFKWWNFFTGILIIFLGLNIIKNFVFSDFGFLYIESFDTIFSFFLIGLLNYSAFRIAEVFEEKEDIEFNRILLFFFTIFYIQFKTNRYELSI